MKIDIESLLKENVRLLDIIDKLQEEVIFRTRMQRIREDELTKIINENKKLQSKLYWWQK